MERRILKKVLTLAGALAALVAVAYGSLYAVNWQRLTRSDCRLPVLMYHDVTTFPELVSRYWMHEDEFARQMDELRAAGIVTRPIDDVLRAWESVEPGACPFLPNEVVITFDIHSRSRHYDLAFPHLERNGLIAHFYVVTGVLGRRRAIQTEAIRNMVDAGMVFGSHTETHEDLPRVPSDVLIPSLAQSRAALAELSGQAITTLAAPGGRYDERVIRDVAAADFEAFFTSDPCYVEPGSSPLRLCRIEIRGDRGPTAIQALRSPGRVALQATHWRLKRMLEHLIGTDRFRDLSRGVGQMGGALP